ncbi:hypothetical protein NQ318_022901 [Aromia moschata]|uniref:Uncharacterized protein n=1 Tax=Aromia moschata TaxID=1265417 RepID=A0AAV8X956_9CUCU|nr:hypothetical protein NQ318_022901 [Aromia moschata]
MTFELSTQVSGDTSISTTAELTSKYHFAAHMGQLINGVDGTAVTTFIQPVHFLNASSSDDEENVM